MDDAPKRQECDDEYFEGVPYAELVIDSVDWTHRGEHIRSRSQRKGAQEFDVEPEWATEAALDSSRLVSRGTSSTSIEIIGLATSAPSRDSDEAGRILKIWLVPKTHNPPGVDWWGASACEANERDRKDYWEVGKED